MSSLISRRRMMQTIGAATLAPSVLATGALPRPQLPAPLAAGWCPEGPATPKLSLVDRCGTRRSKQEFLRSAAVGRNQTLAGPSPEDAAKSGCREMVCRCHDADVHGGCGKAIKRTRSSAECARSCAEKRHHAGSSCEASGQNVEGCQLCLPCNSLRTS